MKLCIRLLVVLSTLLLCRCSLHPDTVPTKAGIWYRREPVTKAPYYVYLPANYCHGKPMKVIISCHGTPPFDIARHHIDTWGMYGDRHNCLVICPELVGTDGILGAGDTDSMIENERRILGILSTLSYKYNIDRANIMLTGFSGGGFPVYWVGLRHPELFSVLVAQNCNFNEGNTDGWYPSAAKDMPIFVYYGENDPGTIKTQSNNAIRYLKSHGFRKIKPMVVRGKRTGHDRNPHFAMNFFRENWRPENSILQSQIASVNKDDQIVASNEVAGDLRSARFGPVPPLP